MASDNFMEQLLNKAAIREEVIETTAEIFEKVDSKESSILLEGGSKKPLTVQEVSLKYGIDPEGEVPIHLRQQVKMDLLGISTIEELQIFNEQVREMAYKINMQRKISTEHLDRLTELNNVFIEEMSSKGIDAKTLPFSAFRDWLKQRQKEIDEAPVAITKRIERYVMTIDHISKGLRNGEIDSTKKHSVKTSTKKYQAIVSIQFLNLPNVQTSEKFNFYEWQIHNAIVSLAKQNQFITDYMIYEVIACTYFNKADANPPEETKKRIREAARKILNCNIIINRENDVPLKNEHDDIKVYEGRLIAGDIVTRKINGREVEGYLITRNSLAYAYASSKSHVVEVEMKYMKTKVRYSIETSIMKEYLIYRIELMKNTNNKIKSRDILYTSIFENIEFTQKTAGGIANKKSKLKGSAAKMLEELKDMDYIKGYDVQKKDRITIEF